MATVFIVEHERPETDDCWEDVKFIGVFSSEATARAAVEKLREQPGFADYPDGFSIEEHTIDRFGWEEGSLKARPEVRRKPNNL